MSSAPTSLPLFGKRSRFGEYLEHLKNLGEKRARKNALSKAKRKIK